MRNIEQKFVYMMQNNCRDFAFIRHILTNPDEVRQILSIDPEKLKTSIVDINIYVENKLKLLTAMYNMFEDYKQQPNHKSLTYTTITLDNLEQSLKDNLNTLNALESPFKIYAEYFDLK